MAGKTMALYLLLCLILVASAKDSHEEKDKSESSENAKPKSRSFFSGTMDMFENFKKRTMSFFSKKQSESQVVIDDAKNKAEELGDKTKAKIQKDAIKMKDRAEYAMKRANDVADELKEKAKTEGLKQSDKVKKLTQELGQEIDERKKYATASIMDMKEDSEKKLKEAIEIAKKKGEEVNRRLYSGSSDAAGKVASGLFSAGEKTAVLSEKLQDKADGKQSAQKE